MTWENVAFLLMGFFSGGVLVGYFNYIANGRLFRSLARIQEANNEMMGHVLKVKAEAEEREAGVQ